MKKKSIVIFVIVLLLGGLFGQAGILEKSQETRSSTQTKEEIPIPIKPLDGHFFYGTNLGKSILAYLFCVDFDCFELEKHIVEERADAVIPLLQLLHYGLPQGMEKEFLGDIRPRVIHLLGVLGDARATIPLIAALQDPNPIVRAKIANAFGEIGGTEGFNALLPLLRDEDQLVRETTAMALGKLKQVEGLPALRDALQIEPKGHVRKAINEAILTIEKR